ncbi:diguanylate cyclase [Alcaligenaceae bacterium]|nr:diguanylate cyclase [Alcaligenaceae bacterium]
MNFPKWSKSRLLLLSLAIALGIGTLVLWQLHESRKAIWLRAEAANTNLLFTVSQVLQHTLEGVDHSIRHSVAMMEKAAHGSGGEPFLDALDDSLLFAAANRPGLGVQLVLDERGGVLRASESLPSNDWDFSDRDYFRVHQERADAGFVIGAPFISRRDGQASVAMSRRWNHADGAFGGVVVQTLKLSMLHDLFSSFELGPDSGINVILSNGDVVVRFPYTGRHVGSSLSGTENFERALRDGQGSFMGVAAIDKVERLYVFRSLEGFPVFVNVAQSRHAILGGWERNAVWLAGAMLALMSACVALAAAAERRLYTQRRIASRLRQAEHELRMVVDSLPVLVGYWDDRLINRMSNIAHWHWCGLTPEQMVGRHISELLPEERYRRVKPYMEATLAGEPQTFELSVPDKNGTVRDLVATYIPDRDGGRVKGLFVLVTDISERKATEMELFREKEQFRILLESIKDGVITTNPEGRILYLNPAAGAMTGWRLDEARGRRMEEVMKVEPPEGGAITSCPLREALDTRRAVKAKVEHVLVSRGGERVHIENSASPILDGQGELTGAVVVFHEVGQVRAMANRMTHLALHDALTGLPNRRRLEPVGRDALSLARSQGRGMAILYLDLDGFKQVNDEYGHAVGDELLLAVTRRLSARLRASDVMYRQGGDEFVVLMASIGAPEEAERLAIRLIESCRTPVSVEGKALMVTVSIGISMYPADGSDLDELIQRADRAMYAAKNDGRDGYAWTGRPPKGLPDGPAA